MARLRPKYRDGLVPDDDFPSSEVKQVGHQDEYHQGGRHHLGDTRPSSEDAAIDGLNMPPEAKAWLKRHPQYVFDERENAKIGKAHTALMAEGYEQNTTAYFVALEDRLGHYKTDATTDRQITAAVARQVDYEPSRRVSVSAPPSRDYLPASNYSKDGSGRIDLTVAQKEAARMAGCSESDYAKGLMELNRRKSFGDYGGSQ